MKIKKYIKYLILFIIILILIALIYFLKRTEIIQNFINKNKQEVVKDITFDIYSYENGVIKALVTAEDTENKIKQLSYLEEGKEKTINVYSKEKVAIDYEIKQDGEYTFYAINNLGETIQKTLVINSNTISDLIKINIESDRELGTVLNVNIEYSKDLNNTYKIGNVNDWKKYEGEFSITSYEVIENNYQDSNNETVTIYAKTEDNVQNKIIISKQSYNLDLKLPDEPVITTTGVEEYPILTENGVCVTGTIEIEYDENYETNNYYSLDNGKTWNIYNGIINTSENENKTSGTVMAKSIKKISGLEVISSATIDLPGDALEEKTYDGDNTTSVNISNTKKRMNISSDIYGKTIYVDYTSKATSNSTSGYTTFRFYDTNNNLLSENKYTSNSRGVKEFIVPNNSAYMTVYRYYGTATIYEIVLANEPIISSTQHYPLLSEKGVETGYCTAQISYDSTSIQKLYKINEGEWQDYNEQIITLKIDDILYAKGIDKNGKETRKISSYTSTLPLDAIEIKAYDKNNTTSIDIHDTTKRININSDIYGKTIYVDYTSKATSNSTSGYTTFRFYDTNNNLLSENKYTSNSRGVKEFIVPNNSAYMTVYRYYGTATIYEISLMKDI